MFKKNKKIKVLDKKNLLEVYSKMCLIRRFQEKVGAIYLQGAIGGFCHLYIGQEAIVTAAKMAAGEHDDFITSYRCHAHAIMCGVEIKEILAELMGKVTGNAKGKGGSMHMFAPEKHFWGGHGIVSAQTSLGAGLAFAAKYKNKNTVTLSFLGDGASNGGQFFESMNMASLWELPVVYIVENNRFSMGTAVSRGTAGKIHKRGEPFGIIGEEVDGMDFFAVYDAVKRATDYSRKNSKPYLLEMDTYRYRGHSMSDPAKYRTREEMECVKKTRDPILSLGNYLKEHFSLTDDDLREYDKQAKEEVAKAVEFAEKSPFPDSSELMKDILPEMESK